METDGSKSRPRRSIRISDLETPGYCRQLPLADTASPLCGRDAASFAAALRIALAEDFACGRAVSLEPSRLPPRPVAGRAAASSARRASAPDDQSAPRKPVVARPSSARSLWRPSKPENAPRPQSETKPPPRTPDPAVSAKDLPASSSWPVTARVSMPKSLKEAAARIAREVGTSFNQFVASAVAERASAMKTAEYFAARKADGGIEAARRLLRTESGPPPELDDRP